VTGTAAASAAVGRMQSILLHDARSAEILRERGGLDAEADALAAEAAACLRELAGFFAADPALEQAALVTGERGIREVELAAECARQLPALARQACEPDAPEHRRGEARELVGRMRAALAAARAAVRPSAAPAMRRSAGAAVVDVDQAHAQLVLADAPAAVSASAADRLARSVPQNTQRAYARQWDEFERWCLGQAVPLRPLPASAHTLAEYVNALAERDLAPASIEQAIAAIRVRHDRAGHAGAPDTTAALAILRTHRRERADRGKHKRQAPAITLGPLRSMVAACDTTSTAGLRDRAIVVLGFAAMLRRSELAALNIGDIRFTDDGLVVAIRSSKTDQDAVGAEVLVPPGSHPDTDPVRVVRAWIGHLRSLGIAEGRLLRSVTNHGTRIGASMTPTAVNDAVRRLAAAAGLDDAETYTAHGLRAGGPTEAARRGVATAHIARHGRWSPTSPQVNEYVRVADLLRDNPMNGIGL
jgi:integrase